jgi:enamine deaminase RidA (YjgF/YER057c/UK114 family)
MATLLNIPGRPAPQGYSHVAIATGERQIYVAGQVGSDDQGEIVPGGLAAQTERALLNVGLALDAAGATPEQLVKLTVYVAGWTPDMYPELGAGLLAAVQARGFPPVPATVIGVQALFTPEHLVEIEGVAVA